MQQRMWFVLGGALILSYGAYHFSNRKKTKACSLLKTQSISQEIKHQMLTACTSLGKNVATGLKNKSTNVPHEQLETYFRKEISSLYEEKEKQILEKHDIQRDEYAAGLIQYSGNVLIERNTKELFDIMERTVRGVPPDFTVAPELLHKFNPLQLKDVYLDMCLRVLIEVLRKIKHLMRTDPSFDPRDNRCFRDAVKQIGLFNFKTKFLQTKGFDPAWGCPNEAIFKALETYKQRDQGFQAVMSNVDKAYEVITKKVTTDPDSLNQEDIPRLIFKEMSSHPEPSSTMALNASAPSKASLGAPSGAKFPPMQNKSVQLPKIVKKERTQTEQDEDLARMMMEELMKRPIQSIVEKPESSLLSAQPKVENVVQQVVNNAELVNEEVPIQSFVLPVQEALKSEPIIQQEAKVQPAVVEVEQVLVEPVVQVEAVLVEPVVQVEAASVEPVVQVEAASVEPVVQVEAASVEPVVQVEAASVEPVVQVEAASVEPVVQVEQIAQPVGVEETEEEKYAKYLDSLDQVEGNQGEQKEQSAYENYLDTTEQVKQVEIEKILESPANVD